ncbi:sensor histidine kinase [Streptomyces griseocarneus]|uniref:sensor histidine kinase n=1 Tax=Streptomyces griseocarneus TaxID=51201 RepID=UPI00167D697F|nr:histidine kinase [Streptomyces griseocarneus]MBZ6476906.1 histidine kinase [Streptomyces griseocarneus]GHG76791.1 two-component sensor histidine kinase [Streptomyces griseocarneus]
MHRIHRTRRDWAADIGLILFAACFAAITSRSIPVPQDMGPGWQVADQVAGGLGCAAVFLRRRWPVQLAVTLLVAGTVAHYMTGPALVAVFTVAAGRPWRVTAWVAALAFAPLPVFLHELPETDQDRAGAALTYFALLAGAIGWGLFRRSRHQLIDSLRERAELAEAGSALRAARATQRAREEIAREMHDVLAHRLSLLSVHAGALEFNPGAPPAEVQRAAGVIRDSAHQALQDLREVIGVLRAPVGDGRPQPTLRDVARLVEEAEETGARIAYEPPGEAETAAAPAALGRTAYRIVQEALTNARKHAPDAPVRVKVSGGPGAGLGIEVRNALPDAAAGEPAIPGAGQGLIGLGERAALAGGRLEHDRDGADFRLAAWLPWPADATGGPPPAG